MSNTPVGVWRRFWANVIDNILAAIGAAVVGLIVFTAAGENVGVAVGVWTYLAVLVFYRPAMLAWHSGQTWGKAAIDARVINTNGAPIGFGRALIRETIVLIFALGTLPYVIDAIWGGARKDKRTIHDMICRTRAVESDTRDNQPPQGDEYAPPVAARL